MTARLPLRLIRPYEEMYLAGLPITKIARLLGMSYATVWQVLARNDHTRVLLKRRGRYDPQKGWERDRKA